MASALNTKINSYSIQKGIEMNTSDQPWVETGTFAQTENTSWTYTTNGPTTSSESPIGGNSSQYFNLDFGRRRRLTVSGSNWGSAFNNTEYSVGFWIKQNTWGYVAGSGIQIFNITPTTLTYGGFAISATANAIGAPEQNFLSIIYQSTTTSLITSYAIPITFTLNNWYYLACIRNGANLEIFVNGQLISTLTDLPTTRAATSINFGSNGASSATPPVNYNISNFYVASSSVIGASEIAQIWTAGSTLNATPVAEPSTASALMTEPTIVIVANDNVQVTTSFLASTTIPDNITVTASQNINIVVTEVLTASADLINNVEVITPTNISFSAQEMTASALLVKPFISEIPMTASATMPNPNVSIPLNYFNLVKQDNPFLYIYDGQLSPINSGYRTHTFNRGSTAFSTDIASPGELSYIGEAKSWRWTASTANDATFNMVADTLNNSFPALMAGGVSDFSIEFWFNTNDVGYAELMTFGRSSTTTGSFLQITLQSGKPVFVYYRTDTSGPSVTTINQTINANQWNHMVVTGDQLSNSDIQYQVWINGTIAGTFTVNYDLRTTLFNLVQIGTMKQTQGAGAYETVFVDEVVLYDKILSNSVIQNHFNFVNNFGPSKNIFASPFTADAQFANAQFLVESNINAIATPITASANIANPTVIPEQIVNVFADPATASALNTDVTIFYGRTFIATPMIAAAESKEGFVLNDIYYEYVQANIAPYRYVTFDAEDTTFDYGIDNDYSVIPTVVGGTIVNPDLGINGKSAKTAGTSYVTDGVILKESEWNDSWGTGQNSYHSAFWFQRAVDDASTTGLRVLWNLNGYKDNQHVVLYQYQGKLHMQFNNGSGTFVEQDTAALDLFDYNRHFVVIEFDHTNNNNNIVRLYVDTVLRSTINLGAYTGTTTNATTADSGPNNELNNHPRLSVGCLITPFAATALPVQPANTKLIIDEIYWDKNSITSTMVTNLFNTMPNKTNKIIIAEPMIASDELVMPAFSTSSILAASPLTASVELIQPITTADREVVTTANVMTATALAVDPRVFQDRIILSDIFVATATFNDPGVAITIPGPTMYASIKLQSSGIYLTKNGSNVRFYPNKVMTPWLAYLRATDVNNILPMREVQ